MATINPLPGRVCQSACFVLRGSGAGRMHAHTLQWRQKPSAVRACTGNKLDD